MKRTDYVMHQRFLFCDHKKTKHFASTLLIKLIGLCILLLDSFPPGLKTYYFSLSTLSDLIYDTLRSFGLLIFQMVFKHDNPFVRNQT